MHDIEPHFNWRNEYIAAEDRKSPFYRREYDEFTFTHKIYNYFIHPQWDAFGSSTLYLKVLFADYEEGYSIIELIGEWNDALHNDVMFLKREVIDHLIDEGVHKFLLIGENVLNFHGDDDSYYEEWYDDISEDGGWIAILNTLEHVAQEMRDTHLDRYVLFGDQLAHINWRPHKPKVIFEAIDGLVQTGEKRLY